MTKRYRVTLRTEILTNLKPGDYGWFWSTVEKRWCSAQILRSHEPLLNDCERAWWIVLEDEDKPLKSGRSEGWLDAELFFSRQLTDDEMNERGLG